MAQIKVYSGSSELTEGVEYVVDSSIIPAIVSQGFRVVIVKKIV